MMFEEFLKISKLTENDITFKTYSEVIEPMYMANDLSKEEFVSILNLKHIKENYPNVNNVAKKIEKLVAEMRANIGKVSLDKENEEFVELAKEFCKLKGLEYCYESELEYEIPLHKCGCSIFTGFVANDLNNIITYAVKSKKLKKIKEN